MVDPILKRISVLSGDTWEHGSPLGLGQPPTDLDPQPWLEDMVVLRQRGRDGAASQLGKGERQNVPGL